VRYLAAARAANELILVGLLSIAFLVEITVLGTLPDDLPVESGPVGPLVAAGAGIVLIASILIRRQVPLLLLLPAFAWVTLSGSPLEGWATPVVALVVATYGIGFGTRDTAAAVGAAGIGALIVAVIVRHPDAVTEAGDLVLAGMVIAGPWLAGLATRKRLTREISLERRALKLERLRDQEMKAAIADERNRIARELHDVVAHAISVIVIQARGGRRALPGDPDATREALNAIEHTSTEALADMRRLLGVLRVKGSGVELAPRPSLREVDGLVAQVRDAGLPIDLLVQGDPVDLPAGVDMSAYRILQEALTNALRHAGPATARVVIRYGDGSLDLEVVDTGRGAISHRPEGHGLAGMRERAALFGGSLDAGPQPGGGFAVHVRLPLEERSA
jgi:signal transduction histidine kinase